MGSLPLALGIDLGTSGVRIAIVNRNKDLIYTSSVNYENNLEDYHDWINSCEKLIREIPKSFKSNLVACSVDGTSGTIIACDFKGDPISKAVPYHSNCIDEIKGILKLSTIKNSSLERYSSIRKALYLTNKYGCDILLRHQADWITGWLLNNWDLGEEGNNIKLGWNLLSKTWLKDVQNLEWRNCLPKIISSGNLFGTVSSSISKRLDLPRNLKIFAGTTDSNAAVLAVNPSSTDGVTVLGSTLVIKRFVNGPIRSHGITNHLVGGQWLSGGASNTGAAVLRRFFSDEDLIELSRQINPEIDSGLKLMPLMIKGERFPVNDPDLEPILGPRPTSDSLYLHGLLESIARIEAQGWNKFEKLGIKAPQRIITIGGGARNPQWRRIRERIIGIPILSSKKQPAEGVALLAMQSIHKSL